MLSRTCGHHFYINLCHIVRFMAHSQFQSSSIVRERAAEFTAPLKTDFHARYQKTDDAILFLSPIGIY